MIAEMRASRETPKRGASTDTALASAAGAVAVGHDRRGRRSLSLAWAWPGAACRPRPPPRCNRASDLQCDGQAAEPGTLATAATSATYPAEQAAKTAPPSQGVR